jgi:hypothetical protein
MMRQTNIDSDTLLPGEVIEMALARLGWFMVRVGFRLVGGRNGGIGLCSQCGPQSRLDEDGCCLMCGADALHLWHLPPASPVCPKTGTPHRWGWCQTGDFDHVVGGPEEYYGCLDCGVNQLRRAVEG